MLSANGRSRNIQDEILSDRCLIDDRYNIIGNLGNIYIYIYIYIIIYIYIYIILYIYIYNIIYIFIHIYIYIYIYRNDSKHNRTLLNTYKM